MKVNATETCPGCGIKFSPSGLSHHLSQTKKPACIAVRQSQPELSGGLAPQFADIDLDASPIQFQGDYYGDYSPDDFDDPDPEQQGPFPPEAGSDSESGDEGAGEVEQTVWEPQPRAANRGTPIPVSRLDGPSIPTTAQREAAERAARRQTFVVRFKASTAGAPIHADERDLGNGAPTSSYKTYAEHVGEGAQDNAYHPFATRMEWEVARWAKLRGSGSTAFSDLLAIEGVSTSVSLPSTQLPMINIAIQVAEALQLSFKNSRELNAIIDKLPSARPEFKRYEILVAGEAFEVYFRDILECIRSLYGDPEFAPLLLLVPEKHYTDNTCEVRVYFDMNTGKWWWATQVSPSHISAPLL